jgi:hypothetical protein
MLTGATESADAADTLLQTLFSCYQGNLIQLDRYPALYTRVIPERPRVTALARYQAAHGELVTSLRHNALKFDAFTLQLITRLTGQMTRTDLVDYFANLGGKGQMRLEKDGKPLAGTALEQAIGEMLDFSLRKLATEGMFPR